MSGSDEALLEAWQQGDTAAANALLDRHFPSLLRFFANKTDQAVEDLIQEAMLECVRSLPSFEGRSSFRTFLFSIAHNVLKRHYERNGRRTRLKRTLELADVPELQSSPSCQAHRSEQRLLLLRALQQLPLQDQVVLELKYWEGLTSNEIATVVGVPRGTVRTRQMHARARLLDKVNELAASSDLARSTVEGFDTWMTRVKRLAHPAVDPHAQ